MSSDVVLTELCRALRGRWLAVAAGTAASSTAGSQLPPSTQPPSPGQHATLPPLLLVAGPDSDFHPIHQAALKYLLLGSHAALKETELPDPALDELVLLLRGGGRHGLAVSGYGADAEPHPLLPRLAGWLDVATPYHPSEREDGAVVELFKIVSFIDGLQPHARLATPVGLPASLLPPEASSELPLACTSPLSRPTIRSTLETWPLFQAYGLQDVGPGGFVTMRHDFADASHALVAAMTHVDAHALKRLLRVAAPALVRAWRAAGAQFGCCRVPARRGALLTPAALLEPLASFADLVTEGHDETTEGSSAAALEAAAAGRGCGAFLAPGPRAVRGSGLASHLARPAPVTDKDKEEEDDELGLYDPLSPPGAAPEATLLLEAHDGSHGLRAARTLFLHSDGGEAKHLGAGQAAYAALAAAVRGVACSAQGLAAMACGGSEAAAAAALSSLLADAARRALEASGAAGVQVTAGVACYDVNGLLLACHRVNSDGSSASGATPAASMASSSPLRPRRLWYLKAAVVLLPSEGATEEGPNAKLGLVFGDTFTEVGGEGGAQGLSVSGHAVRQPASPLLPAGDSAAAVTLRPATAALPLPILTTSVSSAPSAIALCLTSGVPLHQGWSIGGSSAVLAKALEDALAAVATHSFTALGTKRSAGAVKEAGSAVGSYGGLRSRGSAVAAALVHASSSSSAPAAAGEEDAPQHEEASPPPAPVPIQLPSDPVEAYVAAVQAALGPQLAASVGAGVPPEATLLVVDLQAPHHAPPLVLRGALRLYKRGVTLSTLEHGALPFLFSAALDVSAAGSASPLALALVEGKELARQAGPPSVTRLERELVRAGSGWCDTAREEDVLAAAGAAYAAVVAGAGSGSSSGAGATRGSGAVTSSTGSLFGGGSGGLLPLLPVKAAPAAASAASVNAPAATLPLSLDPDTLPSLLLLPMLPSSAAPAGLAPHPLLAGKLAALVLPAEGAPTSGPREAALTVSVLEALPRWRGELPPASALPATFTPPPPLDWRAGTGAALWGAYATCAEAVPQLACVSNALDAAAAVEHACLVDALAACKAEAAASGVPVVSSPSSAAQPLVLHVLAAVPGATGTRAIAKALARALATASRGSGRSGEGTVPLWSQADADAGAAAVALAASATAGQRQVVLVGKPGCPPWEVAAAFAAAARLGAGTWTLGGTALCLPSRGLTWDDRQTRVPSGVRATAARAWAQAVFVTLGPHESAAGYEAAVAAAAAAAASASAATARPARGPSGAKAASTVASSGGGAAAFAALLGLAGVATKALSDASSSTTAPTIVTSYAGDFPAPAAAAVASLWAAAATPGPAAAALAHGRAITAGVDAALLGPHLSSAPGALPVSPAEAFLPETCVPAVLPGGFLARQVGAPPPCQFDALTLRLPLPLDGERLRGMLLEEGLRLARDRAASVLALAASMRSGGGGRPVTFTPPGLALTLARHPGCSEEACLPASLLGGVVTLNLWSVEGAVPIVQPQAGDASSSGFADAVAAFSGVTACAPVAHAQTSTRVLRLSSRPGQVFAVASTASEEDAAASGWLTLSGPGLSHPAVAAALQATLWARCRPQLPSAEALLAGTPSFVSAFADDGAAPDMPALLGTDAAARDALAWHYRDRLPADVTTDGVSHYTLDGRVLPHHPAAAELLAAHAASWRALATAVRLVSGAIAAAACAEAAAAGVPLPALDEGQPALPPDWAPRAAAAIAAVEEAVASCKAVRGGASEASKPTTAAAAAMDVAAAMPDALPSNDEPEAPAAPAPALPWWELTRRLVAWAAAAQSGLRHAAHHLH